MLLNLSKKTALVIDDFQNMRTTLRQMLITIGLQDIDTASKAEDALELMERRRYDIVLCDYNLGAGMDGQQLLETSRARKLVGLDTTYIMVTAENSYEMVMGAMETLPDAYLTKPFTKDLLLARLRRVVPRKEALQGVERTLQKNDLSGAIKLLDGLLSGQKQNLGELFRLKASLLYEAGELSAAEAVCHQVNNIRPVAWALTMLGQIAMQREQDGEAARLFRKSIELTPAYMPAHDGLASILEKTGQAEAAMEVLQAAAARSAKSFSRQRHLARLAHLLGQHETAERAWRRAIGLAQQVGNDHPAYHVALIATLAGRGDLAEARSVEKYVNQEFRLHGELQWWSLTASLLILARQDDGAVREEALQELEILRQGSPPPQLAAGLIESALREMGEEQRIASLHQPAPIL